MISHEYMGDHHRGVVREENQDAFAVQTLAENKLLAVVCDGMGGARAGNIASTLAVDSFLELFGQLWKDKQVADEQMLESAAAYANEVVHRRSTTDESCFGMGTTMVAALLDGSRAVILNEGDSRAYYITQKDITRITRDHSLVEDLVLRGDLTPDQARTHPHKNLITRALGAEAELHADLFIQEVNQEEFLLLCSDGLSNVVSDQEMLYEVIHGGPADECCQRLLDIALKRGAPDNVTVALIRC